MATYTAHSNRFQDARQVVADLLSGLAGIPPDDNAIGFLTCDSQLDAQPILDGLCAAVPFDIVGGSTMLFPLAARGDEISAQLVVLSRPGLRFAVRVSGPLDAAHAQETVQALYDECAGALDGSPALWMPFFPLMPGVPVYRFLNALFECAGQVPVFGGITTDDLETTKAAVYAGGRQYADRMVLVAFGGAVRPVFGVGSRMTPMADYMPTITEADGNIVRRVDEMTFVAYMRSLGLKPERHVNGVDALVQYGPLPMRVRTAERENIPELRCISYTNLDEGSAAFSNRLPVGAQVGIGLITREDVRLSAHECVEEIRAGIEAGTSDGYRYELLFCLPCVARYFATVGGENIDSALLSRELPQNLAISTYYAFGEIVPTVRDDGSLHNRWFNASIILCAI